MEKINLDVVRQSSPFFIFWERVLTHGIEDFTYTLSYGFGYFLRRIVTRYDGVNTATGKLAPPLYIEFVDNWNNRARQVQPIPLPLLSTPNNGGNTEHEIQSVTPHTFTVKTGKSSEKILNYYHPYNDVIRFSIRGGGTPMSTYPAIVYPSIQIMFDGYYCPDEKYSAVFGGLRIPASSPHRIPAHIVKKGKRFVPRQHMKRI